MTRFKGGTQIRTGDKGFAILCLTTWPCCRGEQPLPSGSGHAPGSLLFLCNGHGEDLITLRIIQAIHRRAPRRPLTVLPLVGTGRVFDAAVQQGWLKGMGPRAALPSGGFSNQSLRGLLADVSAGLPTLSWTQWRLVRRLGHDRQPIVAG